MFCIHPLCDTIADSVGPSLCFGFKRGERHDINKKCLCVNHAYSTQYQQLCTRCLVTGICSEFSNIIHESYMYYEDFFKTEYVLVLNSNFCLHILYSNLVRLPIQYTLYEKYGYNLYVKVCKLVLDDDMFLMFTYKPLWRQICRASDLYPSVLPRDIQNIIMSYLLNN
jgi:hypothetical protein